MSLNLSPDAPVTVNDAGGKQSDPGCRMQDAPLGFLRVGQVFAYGAQKYEPGNWRLIPATDHVNHAIVHLLAWLSGDRQDDHLGHAACRAVMAVETEAQDKLGAVIHDAIASLGTSAPSPGQGWRPVGPDGGPTDEDEDGALAAHFMENVWVMDRGIVRRGYWGPKTHEWVLASEDGTWSYEARTNVTHWRPLGLEEEEE